MLSCHLVSLQQVNAGLTVAASFSLHTVLHLWANELFCQLFLHAFAPVFDKHNMLYQHSSWQHSTTTLFYSQRYYGIRGSSSGNGNKFEYAVLHMLTRSVHPNVEEVVWIRHTFHYCRWNGAMTWNEDGICEGEDANFGHS